MPCMRNKTNFIVGPQEPLLATVKKWKVAWFGHVARCNNLSKTILQGTLEGGQRCGQQRKCWMDNFKEWTFLPMPETGRGSLLNRLSCPPSNPIGQGTELNFGFMNNEFDHEAESLLPSSSSQPHPQILSLFHMMELG